MAKDAYTIRQQIEDEIKEAKRLKKTVSSREDVSFSDGQIDAFRSVLRMLDEQERG